MKFKVVRISPDETEVIEIIEKKDLFEACKYMNKWYGEDNTDVDLFFADWDYE